MDPKGVPRVTSHIQSPSPRCHPPSHPAPAWPWRPATGRSGGGHGAHNFLNPPRLRIPSGKLT